MLTKEDLRRFGYKEFKMPPSKSAEIFMQKKIRVGDDEDDVYFIDAFFYSFRLPNTGEVHENWEFETQMRGGEDNDFFFNILTVGTRLETPEDLRKIEDFFFFQFNLAKSL